MRTIRNGQNLAVLVDRDALDAGRADVDPDQRVHRYAPSAAYTNS